MPQVCHRTWVCLDLSECQISDAVTLLVKLESQWMESSLLILKLVLRSKAARNCIIGGDYSEVTVIHPRKEYPELWP